MQKQKRARRALLAIVKSECDRAELDLMEDPRRLLIVAPIGRRVGIRITLSSIILAAPIAVQRAAISYAVRGDLGAWSIAARWFDANSWRLPPVREPRGALRTAGTVHDLDALLARVRARAFEGRDLGFLRIAWGRRTRGPRTSTIKLGTYSAEERLVRVHPALDAAWVPAGFVEAVIAHEILHHTLGCTDHPERFRAFEHALPDHAAWMRWERRSIDALLAA